MHCFQLDGTTHSFSDVLCHFRANGDRPDRLGISLCPDWPQTWDDLHRLTLHACPGAKKPQAKAASDSTRIVLKRRAAGPCSLWVIESPCLHSGPQRRGPAPTNSHSLLSCTRKSNLPTPGVQSRQLFRGQQLQQGARNFLTNVFDGAPHPAGQDAESAFKKHSSKDAVRIAIVCAQSIPKLCAQTMRESMII